MKLLSDHWLPARRLSGSSTLVRPCDIACGLPDGGITADPIIAIDWPRADFRVAALEFLIGLLTVACPPETQRGWAAWWRDPPSPDTLANAFAPLAHAFSLDGDGPRFLQDHEDLQGDSLPVETLLIEAPGESGRRNNTALLVKPDRVQRLSRGAAAMALFTLQTYAPAGGRGNLTSLRGGGPLTTLVLPQQAPGGPALSLWHLLWANVPVVEAGARPAADALALVFPWLAATRTADRFPTTAPGPEAHELQAFWGMPRRIRLDFVPNADKLPCDVTGHVDEVIVTGWRQRPNGVRYAAWTHPLSPYYADKKSGGWLPVHPQPGGIFYRHWYGLVAERKGASRPAACVAAWRGDRERRVASPDSRLLAAGYDMDNMKARAFVESEMPLPGGGDPEVEHAVTGWAHCLIEAADEAARAVRLALRDALFTRDTSLDSGPLDTAYQTVWSQTQDAFFAQLHACAAASGDTSALGETWCDLLRRVALMVFDQAAPLDPAVASFDPHRIVRARVSLVWTFQGRTAAGVRLFTALGIALPSTPGKKKRSKAKEPA